jgi:hypothetical protein
MTTSCQHHTMLIDEALQKIVQDYSSPAVP